MKDKIKLLAEKLYDNPTLSWENDYTIKAFCDGYEMAQKELLTKEDLYNCLGHFAYKYGITINGNDIDNWIKNLER